MSETADVAIIGGGAAGIAAGIFAAQAAAPNTRIVILDSAKTLGAKILVSGGGRCNVTHDEVAADDFNGARTFVRNVLAAFPAQAAVQWFESIGIPLKREETGKLFPVANTARAVLGALLGRCEVLGVALQTSCRVEAIVPPAAPGGTFSITHNRGSLECNRLIMATGGKSLPLTGSDGSGWAIAQQLGHTVTRTCAALVPLVLDEKMFHASLAGIALEAQLSTFSENQLVDRRAGSLLWTHFGISGPVAMDASRHWVMAHEGGAATRMECNLLPSESFETLEGWLIDLALQRPKLSIAGAVAMRLPERVAGAVITHAGVDRATMCGQLTRDARRALVHTLTALPLSIIRHRGWNYAEVTAGGIPLNEVSQRTMKSRKVPGLHFVGEMLDCDGRIGGFNFQWAWATGYLAGHAVGKAFSTGQTPRARP
ncbi:MAG: NAD(P)/FAD-dependent oxidoreductase [Planctomycetota bacterium]|nr:NAD(P)/FAD-dependent oxidoreductase [Planctomycetota bacterium]